VATAASVDRRRLIGRSAPISHLPGAPECKRDGSSGVLVDTHVWLDCIDASSAWHDCALDALQECSRKFPLHVNLVI
jgi:hypothetical protein